jgi:calcium-dependent protein kinase
MAERDNQSFTEEQARGIFLQVMNAISFIHSRNVAHRDIKPENFVFSTLSSDHIKMIDFGLSSSFISLVEAQSKQHLLRMGTPVGTPFYVAPEMLNKNYTEKCDIWSAGVMLYVILCGYPPFMSKHFEGIKKKILKGKVVFQEENWGNISQEARQLITSMLVPEEIRPTAQECLEHPWF